MARLAEIVFLAGLLQKGATLAVEAQRQAGRRLGVKARLAPWVLLLSIALLARLAPLLQAQQGLYQG
jgi:hypothetical protein